MRRYSRIFKKKQFECSIQILGEANLALYYNISRKKRFPRIITFETMKIENGILSKWDFLI